MSFLFQNPKIWQPRLLLLLLLLTYGCGDSTDREPRAHVEDLSYKLLPGEARILSGVLVNDSDVVIEAAQIEVSLFDSDNRRISSMLILVQDLAPRSSKEFREPVSSNLDIQGARVRSIFIP